MGTGCVGDVSGSIMSQDGAQLTDLDNPGSEEPLDLSTVDKDKETTEVG